MYTEDSKLAGKNVEILPYLHERIIMRNEAAKKKNLYTLYDIHLILSYYRKIATDAGLNWILVVAQNLHETDYLTSWWSDRPRRNPAGIGVTGETKRLATGAEWQFDKSAMIFKRGFAFKNWEDSVYAHVGHLLSYMYKDEDLCGNKYAISEKSPRKYAISKDRRGTVVTLKDLEGKWAPGDNYGNAIAKTANWIIQ